MNQILPPHDTDIEKDVLSVMCNRPELIYQVENILNTECFYRMDHQYLFDVIMNIHNSGSSVTQSAILHQIVPTGKKDILATYQEIKKFFTSDRHLASNAEVLVELSTKRALLVKAYELLGMIEKNAQIEDIEREVSEATNIVISRNTNTEPILMGEAVDGMLELMNREKTEGISGITTGVSILDSITGGWEFDDKVIIAGRPGMGKTAVATYHANVAAAAGNPTAFVSLEVRPSKLASRMISNSSGFSASDITKGRLADNQKKIVVERGNSARKLPLYFYDNTRSRDINDITRTLRSWHRKYGLKIVFIDYIGLICDRTVKNRSDKTAVTESVQSKLTELGDQLGIPLIIFSQLNRENESKSDKRPTLNNLKSSGKLEEDATRVIFLYRQDYYDANESDSRGVDFIPSHNIEYIFAKNREGELGPVELKCNVALNRVYEISRVPAAQPQLNGFQKNESLNGHSHSFN
ncbi:replicative DNA helicase [Dyadobacter sandarakinus]|uniref:DNA 5'-3' helicase n=1 Tax=Dyadobacter sandarakinus TaxID=2747268 RepID=A0ABX7I166_9BACT|nr:replicative DNA helicase [Dyadobacter sandarakinus]QRQ99768.1 AAA family ATPase [Dyadobacter sandarakinus]